MLYTLAKRALFSLLSLLAYSTIQADIAQGTMENLSSVVTTGGDLRLQVEVAESEMSPLGMSKDSLEAIVQKLLMDSGITVASDSDRPLLMLRVKSVLSQTIVASFIQLAFYENAILLRGNNKIQAMTWSQAALLTTGKAEMAQETVKAVTAMTNLFIKDYQTAFGVKAPPASVKTAPSNPPVPQVETPVIAPTPVPTPVMPTETTEPTSNQSIPTDASPKLLPEQAQ